MSEQKTQNKTHIYYEWQCATLMYAYDIVEPLNRLNEDGIAARRQRVELDVYDLFVRAVPAELREDPTKNIPADVVMKLTKATLRRALEIAGEETERRRDEETK